MQIVGFSWLEQREWLETNGLGGYSSSTLIGLNTRRYHGLLIAGFSPEDRRLLLSKIVERASVGKKSYEFSTNQYWDAISPEGYRHQKSFSLDPFPAFEYEVPGLKVEKRVCMPHGHNAVIVEYRLKSGGRDVIFEGDFLTTSRDHHWTLKGPDWNYTFSRSGNLLTLRPSHRKPPSLCIGSSLGDISKPPEENRVNDFFYRKELERGYPCLEDMFLGGSFRLLTEGDERFFIVASADMSKRGAQETCKKLLRDPSGVIEREAARREELIKGFRLNQKGSKPRGTSLLVGASDDFIVKKGAGTAIIAGYPWFGEWGRDSLIALPGLLLTTGRKREAKQVLSSLVAEMKDGRIPNNFMARASFNSFDSSLWLFWTVWKYLEYTGDYGFVKKKLWPQMKKIIKSYSSIACADGLLDNGKHSQTWMDAIVGGRGVTPRTGKAVEIQALWFNALRVASKLARRFGEKDRYSDRARLVKRSFNESFWNKSEGYPYDCIGEGGPDGAIRPNALFSISLPFAVLEKGRFRSAISVAKRDLLTPYGLRSLSPRDSRYRGSAGGDQTDRDLSYHQGDVWPWLMGPFVDAYKKVHSGSPKRLIRALLNEHIASAGVGCISEIFDGDPPHKPAGCINQAWSVGELMRVLAEEGN